MSNTRDATEPQFATLPKQAQERLAEIHGRDESKELFTSDLSTSEFLLVKEAGFAIGTAVEEISKDHVIEPPTLVLPLID